MTVFLIVGELDTMNTIRRSHLICLHLLYPFFSGADQSCGVRAVDLLMFVTANARVLMQTQLCKLDRL